MEIIKHPVFKRITSFVLAVLLVCAFFPISASFANKTNSASAADNVELNVIAPGGYIPCIKSGDNYSELSKDSSNDYYKKNVSGTDNVDLALKLVGKSDQKIIFVDDSIAHWGGLRIYAWTDGTDDHNAVWPGESMHAVPGESDLYYVVLSNSYNRIIINGGTGDNIKQTGDQILGGNNCFKPTNNFDGTTHEGGGQNYQCSSSNTNKVVMKGSYRVESSQLTDDIAVVTLSGDDTVVENFEKITSANLTVNSGNTCYKKGTYTVSSSSFTDYTRTLYVDNQELSSTSWSPQATKDYVVKATYSTDYSWISYTETLNVTVKENFEVTGSWELNSSNKEDNIDTSTGACVISSDDQDITVTYEYKPTKVLYNGTEITDYSIGYSAEGLTLDNGKFKVNANSSGNYTLTATLTYSSDTYSNTLGITVSNPDISMKLSTADSSKKILEDGGQFYSSDNNLKAKVTYTSSDSFVIKNVKIKYKDASDETKSISVDSSDTTVDIPSSAFVDNVAKLTLTADCADGYKFNKTYVVNYRTTTEQPKDMKFSNQDNNDTRYYVQSDSNNKVTMTFSLEKNFLLNNNSVSVVGKEGNTLSNVTVSKTTDGETNKYTVKFYKSEAQINDTYNLKITDKLGLTSTIKFDSYIDNAAPEIQKVDFSNASTALEDVASVLSFGIYSNEDIIVTVYVSDSDSGVDSILLNSNDSYTPTLEGDLVYDSTGNVYTQTFRIPVKDENDKVDPFKLVATAVDKADNSTTKGVDDLAITVDNESRERIVNFELVASKAAPIIGFTDKTTIENTADGEEKTPIYGSNAEIGFDVNDDTANSGIKNVSVYFGNDKDHLTDDVTSSCELPKSYTTSKVTDVKSSYTADIKETGYYYLKVVAENNSRNTSEKIYKIYADITPPEVTAISVDVDDNGKGFDKVASLISGGLYTHKSVSVAVKVEDPSYSSGIKQNNGSIKIDNDGEIISGKVSVDKQDNSKADGKFNFSLSEEEYKEWSLAEMGIISVDNAGNEGKHTFNSKLDIITIQGKTLNQYKENSFDTIVISNIPPKIEDITVKAASDGSGKHSYNNYYPNHIDAEFTINGGFANNDTQYIYDYSANLSGPVNDSIHEVIKDSHSKKYNGSWKIKDINSGTYKDLKTGKYNITLEAKNYAKLSSSGKTTFYVDDDKPKVKSFTIDKKDREHFKKDPQVVAPNTSNYSFFFDKDVKLGVKVADGTAEGNSGIDKVMYGVNEYKPGKPFKDEVTTTFHKITPDADGNYYIDVRDGFRGQIYAYTIDKVGNQSEIKALNGGTIVEVDNGKNKKLKASTVKLKLETTTDSRTSDGQKLFDEDVKVTITASDKFSGIKSLKYRVTAENGSVLVKDTEEISLKSCEITKDNGIISTAKKTITIDDSKSYNDILVTVTVTDKTGHTNNGGDVFNAKGDLLKAFSIDTIAPKITVTYNHNEIKNGGEHYYNKNENATVTVTDRNFDPLKASAAMKITANNGGRIPAFSWGGPTDAGNNKMSYSAKLEFPGEDSDYEFTVSPFSDRVGNTSSYTQDHKFTVDKVKPEISFDPAESKDFYNETRTVNVSVEERNFDSNKAEIENENGSTGSWSKGEKHHSMDVTFDRDGDCSIAAKVTDKAGNQASKDRQTFTVDKTLPEVEIKQVKDGQAFGDGSSVTPEIVIKDDHLSKVEAKLEKLGSNGADWVPISPELQTIMDPANQVRSYSGKTFVANNIPGTKGNDGIYRLTVVATDSADNSNPDMECETNAGGKKNLKTLEFSINRFGSTYKAGSGNVAKIVKSGFANVEQDIRITEINVNKLSNNKVTIAHDNDKVKELKRGTDYSLGEPKQENGKLTYTYIINKNNFKNEGSYTVTVSSKDAAENKSTNRTSKLNKFPVSFIMDKTKPEITVSGVESGVPYEEAAKTVKILCEDNYINPKTLAIELNGKKLKEGVDYTLGKKEYGTVSAEMKIEAGDNEAENLKVYISDYATNKGEEDVENFILSASFLTRFFYNTPLVIAVVAVLVLIIAGAVVLVVRKRKAKAQ